MERQPKSRASRRYGRWLLRQQSTLTAVETDLHGSGASRLVVKDVGFDLANMLDEEASAAGITPEAATEGIEPAPTTGTTA